jgi:P-aminobenzoate N-oxygenase AurF
MAVIDVVPRHSIETLEALNEKSVKQAYSIDDLGWDRPIQRDKKWSPDAIAPLVHLPAYQLLEERHRLRYNQLFGLGVCEQFVWFEQDLLCGVFRSLFRQAPDMPPLLRTALEHFVEEENKHSEMFWRMCEKSEPQWYPTRRFYLFNTTWAQDRFFGLMLRYPKQFLMWIWTVIFFEERTVDYCRMYRKSEKKDPGGIDPSYVELHDYHFKDEARHFQLDQHILTWLYDPQPRWKKRVAGRMFHGLMKAFTSPRRTTKRLLEVMGEEFPELKREAIPRLLQELPSLRTNQSFHQAAFSRKAVGRSMALFAEYPELDSLWDLFILEDKVPAKQGTTEA